MKLGSDHFTNHPFLEKQTRNCISNQMKNGASSSNDSSNGRRSLQFIIKHRDVEKWGVINGDTRTRPAKKETIISNRNGIIVKISENVTIRGIGAIEENSKRGFFDAQNKVSFKESSSKTPNSKLQCETCTRIRIRPLKNSSKNQCSRCSIRESLKESSEVKSTMERAMGDVDKENVRQRELNRRKYIYELAARLKEKEEENEFLKNKLITSDEERARIMVKMKIQGELLMEMIGKLSAIDMSLETTSTEEKH